MVLSILCKVGVLQQAQKFASSSSSCPHRVHKYALEHGFMSAPHIVQYIALIARSVLQAGHF